LPPRSTPADTSQKDTIRDPDGLLKWLAKERATIQLADAKDVVARTAALQAVLRQWIVHV